VALIVETAQHSEEANKTLHEQITKKNEIIKTADAKFGQVTSELEALKRSILITVTLIVQESNKTLLQKIAKKDEMMKTANAKLQHLTSQLEALKGTIF